jgi:hypothetical protein
MVAANTRDKNLVFYFYDLSGTELLGKKYLGEGFTNEFGDIDILPDGRFVVTGKTFVFNEIPRIFVTTINPDFLKE